MQDARDEHGPRTTSDVDGVPFVERTGVVESFLDRRGEPTHGPREGVERLSPTRSTRSTTKWRDPRTRPLFALAMVVVLALGALAGAGGLVGSAAAANHPNFVVTNLDTNSPVVEGETITVEATIENTGVSTGTQTVEFSTTPDGVVDTADLTLDPGQSATETFEWVTEDGDTGVPNVNVETDNFTSGFEVVIEEGATIDGQVVDAATGDGVEGATVTFVDTASNATVATTSTDATGAYVSPPLAASGTEYNLSVSVAGYNTETRTVTLPNGGSTVDVALWRDLDGDGSEGTPYVIHDVAELQTVQHDLDAHYVVANDFSAASAANWNDEPGPGDPLGFAPVGQTDGFTGTLDGQGYTISNLTINRPDATQPVGLFGLLENATITNLALEDVDVFGDWQTGGLAGENVDGTIEHVTVDGSVTGPFQVGGLVGQNDDGSLSDASVGVEVTGSDEEIGGLVGHNAGGSIESASASGKVSGSNNEVGGLVGINVDATLTDVSATGDVAGDDSVGVLVGWNDEGTVENGMATGDVDGVLFVGGLVGENDDGSVRDSSANGAVEGENVVGGLVGDNEGLVATGTATGTVDGSNEVGGLVGTNQDLVADGSATGAVDGGDAVGGLVGENDGGTVASSSASGEVSGDENEIGGLVGANGEDAVVANASASGAVTGSVFVGGLAGANDGVIRDATASGDVSAADPGWQVGGLVGSNEGAIERSAASGDVTGVQRIGGLVGHNDEGTVVDAGASGDISATGANVGGLVGLNSGSGDVHGVVARSWASGNVEGEFGVGGLVGDNRNGARIEASFATGAVAGNESVGGLVGANRHLAGTAPVVTVTTSYATGSVVGDTDVGGLVGNNSFGVVEEGYAAGAVTSTGGTVTVGGLVGANDDTVTNGYWDVSATGQTTSVGSPATNGLATAEMTGASAETTLSGFDFATNWTTTDAYPRLRWSVEDLVLETGSTTLEPGETTPAPVTLSIADGTTVYATETATYGSDDASVATVADGVVSTHEAGTTTLEAEHAGFADTATLDVVASDGGDGGGGGGALDPPGTPAIGVDSVTIGDDVLAPGESTTITVTLANDGDGDGTHEVVLLVDGEAVDSTDAFVPAGGTRTVTFAPSFDDVGEYAVGVDGTDAGTVTVRKGRSGESPTATDDPTGPQTTTDAATDPDEGGGPTPGENGGAPQPERDGGLQLVAGLLTVGAALGAVVGLSFWLRTRG